MGTVPSDRACQDLPGIGRIRAGIDPWANRTKKYSNLVPGYPTCLYCSLTFTYEECEQTIQINTSKMILDTEHSDINTITCSIRYISM